MIDMTPESAQFGVLPVSTHGGPHTNSVDENPPDGNDGSMSFPGATGEVVAIVIVPGTRYLDSWYSFASPVVLPYYEPGVNGYYDPTAGQHGCEQQSLKINWDKIADLEGKNSTVGYMVKDNQGNLTGKGGVTIASGFDIGVHNAADLQKMHLPADLITKLTPYTEKTLQVANTYLAAHPLSIDFIDAQNINVGAHSETLGRLVADYDGRTHAGAFYELPAEAQTVIASVAFQYGSIKLKTPSFFDDVVRLDWTAAIKELRNFGDDFPTRRGKEANYLEQGQKSGHLPSTAC